MDMQNLPNTANSVDSPPGNAEALLVCAGEPLQPELGKSDLQDACSGDSCSQNELPGDAALSRDSSPSPPPSSKSSSVDLSEITPVCMEGPSYTSIMDVCSTAAQQIRLTINEVLSSRNDEGDSCTITEDTSSLLEESLKQKLEDFENAVRNNMSDHVSEHFCEDHGDAGMSEVEKVSEAQVSANECNLVSTNVAHAVCRTEELSREPWEEAGEQKSTETKEDENKDSFLEEKKFQACSAGGPITVDEKLQKRSQRNASNKKKGEKSVDQILKSLSGFATTEEKLQALCRKHTETLDDLKYAEQRLKQSERQVIQLSKEKEQLQAEHNRMVLAKSRLESLCRELQRQNKAVKEESLLRIREEEEKRKEVASKFQTTLNDISNLMQENSKKNLQLKEENAELAQKLKTLVEHYEMWEKHMEKVVQQKDLEAQLAKAKHAKTNLQLKQETEKFLREKQSLLENMSELQKKCTQLATNELQLRAELGDYTSKYEEFQSVLNKSNQVFASFKTDMESTSKKIKKLEKETNIWKQKWENSNNALLEMVTDKQKRDKELINAHNRILTLEKLCRALQAERNDLQNQIKAQNPNTNFVTNPAADLDAETAEAC